uniref:ORF89a n=1 Tax=Pinus koraiensis TaxID=88728 RepID=Q85WU1_PINKO|nr:ORF89a [Pinus koraiensis]
MLRDMVPIPKLIIRKSLFTVFYRYLYKIRKIRNDRNDQIVQHFGGLELVYCSTQCPIKQWIIHFSKRIPLRIGEFHSPFYNIFSGRSMA